MQAQRKRIAPMLDISYISSLQNVSYIISVNLYINEIDIVPQLLYDIWHIAYVFFFFLNKL